jgi:hypothetical protein
MAAKKGAKAPLMRAPEETPVTRNEISRTVVEHPTPRALPVGEVLHALQAQAKDAITGSFFEDGATTETTPLMKRMRSEIGAAEVSAKQRDSTVQAHVALEVRCDRDEQGDAGRYQVRADGHVARESNEGLVKANIPVSITVNDADGSLKLDSDEMREEIANAIRPTNDAFERSPRQ